MDRVIVIPDVHGRKFWRGAMSFADSVPIVFLGDYLDPYWDEGISPQEAFERLQEIIDFKKIYPDSVTLLLGNHDLHYISSVVGGCRYDWRTAHLNKELLLTNLHLFDIAHAEVSGSRQYLFTHAGVLKDWYSEHYLITGKETAEQMANLLNGQFHSSISRSGFLGTLSETSRIRGGNNAVGSPVWADVTEQNREAYEFEGIFQVFGHTMMHHERITPYWACLDCREAFTLELTTGKFEVL